MRSRKIGFKRQDKEKMKLDDLWLKVHKKVNEQSLMPFAAANSAAGHVLKTTKKRVRHWPSADIYPATAGTKCIWHGRCFKIESRRGLFWGMMRCAWIALVESVSKTELEPLALS